MRVEGAPCGPAATSAATCAFMHRLVRQHRLADDVADGEDVRHVGAHLRVDGDEAAVGDGHAGLVGGDLLAVRRAAGGLQDHVVLDRLRRARLSPSNLT